MKYIVVAGARPNFMKIAPVMRAFAARKDLRTDQVLLVHTGQHYSRNMSQDFFEELQIPKPDINLEVGSGSHAEQTGQIMIAFERVCIEHRPDWIIVVGDVNSTIACALAARKLGISVAHVEAGLRSRDMSMPEEINRLCTDTICDLLFTTDELANENLRKEGVSEDRICFAGNTMIDTLFHHVEMARSKPLPEGIEKGQYAVLTLHRPGNVDSPDQLASIFDALNKIAVRLPIVFPVHPRTAPKLGTLALHSNIRLTESMSYLPFLNLVANSKMVLTDSGGIQEETTVLGIPCLTMRSNTERPITCEIGTNILVGTNPANILKHAMAVLDGNLRPSSIPERWDGHAAERIVNVLVSQQSPAFAV
jgi:UDP-N-acetylglucosamine 2-epimerase (non-hydrolysing)